MKKCLTLFGFLMFTALFVLGQEDNVNVKLLKKLDKLPGVEVVKYEKGIGDVQDFFELLVLQPVDHNNPDGPVFKQRVFLAHRNFKKPVVLITEGYTAHSFD